MSEEGLRDAPEGHLTPRSRRGPRLILWVLGIYLAAFGVASQRFENHVDRIETKAIIIAATAAAALDGIARLQRMKLPYPPEIFKPWSVLFSFIPAMESRHPANVEEMRGLVVSLRDQLSKRDLSGADLRWARSAERTSTGRISAGQTSARQISEKRTCVGRTFVGQTSKRRTSAGRTSTTQTSAMQT